jgi:hypothetical protein
MARNENQVLDLDAVVETVETIASRRALNRRNFIAALGMTGAAAGAAMLTGCSNQTAPVSSTGIGPVDVLNFALNLEYLEATFYSFITQGTDLPSSLLTGSGAVTNAPAKLTFTGTNAAQITDMLNEIYFDELSHVKDLLSMVGSSAIARPALNLGALGAVTATNAISIARALEDVGATAYAGAAPLLTDTTLTAAAQILAVEGFHAGALRLTAIQNPTIAAYSAVDSLDVKPADPGTAALSAAGPTSSGAFFATAGTASANSSTPAGFAFARTTSQVLAIVFFPSGVNGTINTV